MNNDSGPIYSVTVTTTSVHYLAPAADLLQVDEQVVYGEAGYQGIVKRPELDGTKAEFRVAVHLSKRRTLTDTPEWKLHALFESKAHVSSKVEYPFRVLN